MNVIKVASTYKITISTNKIAVSTIKILISTNKDTEILRENIGHRPLVIDRWGKLKSIRQNFIKIRIAEGNDFCSCMKLFTSGMKLLIHLEKNFYSHKAQTS